MNRISQFWIGISVFFCLSSCGVSGALVLNHHSTQVKFERANFRYVEKVSGSAEVEYILLIGGLNRKQLYENAYSDLVENANLEMGARALANIITEEHLVGLPPFYYKRTITVSAHVVEFVP